MLKSVYFYYTWSLNSAYCYLLCIIAYFIYARNEIGKVYSIVEVSVLFISLIWGSLTAFPIDYILLCGVVYTVFRLSQNSREIVLKVWTWVLGAILSISLIGYLVVPFGLLPNLGPVNYMDSNHYCYANYGIVLFPLNSWSFTRFTSLFLEPGHIAMISCFTLYVNRYNFRKINVWMILIPLLFAMSLAGYVVGVVGYVIYQMSNNSFGLLLKKVIPYLFAILLVWFGAANYKGGDNIINQLIIERLAYDEELGIQGNNRFHGDIDDDFEVYLSNGVIVTGLGSEEFYKRIKDDTYSGAGFKLFMLHRGIIGTVLVFLFYLMVAYGSVNKKFMYGLLAVYIMTFLQRSYPFMLVWIVIFILASQKLQKQDDF